MTMGLKANADGSGAIQVGGSDAITITSGLVVSMNGGAPYPLVSSAVQNSTSGTSIDFTGIPSWVKRITVMFQGVSTSGTSVIIVQLGAGSATTSGYLGGAMSVQSTSPTSANYTTGFGLSPQQSAAAIHHGVMTISLVNSSTNAWAASSTSSRSDLAQSGSSAGSIALAGVLDRIRITTVNGTDTFDAGSINILYE